MLADSATKLHLYQYKGGDAPTQTQPKIKLKDIETGLSVELNYVYQDYAGGIRGADITVGGNKVWWLHFEDPLSTQKDLPLKVCHDSHCTEVLVYNTAGVLKLPW